MREETKWRQALLLLIEPDVGLKMMVEEACM